MDQGKLDAVAAALGRALDRRSGLKSLAAGVAALVGGAIAGGHPVAARPGRRSRRGKPSQ